MTNQFINKIIGILLLVFVAGCGEKGTLFTLVTEEHSNVGFSNDIVENEEFNINQYLYAHDGTGVSVGDFNNDGLTDIYFTANQSANRLYLNKGDFVFEDVTESAGVAGPVGPQYWTTGSTAVDINQDGLLDLYVNQVSNLKNFNGRNQLYVNNGDGTFTERAKDYGLDLESYAQQAVFFDYDLDGDLDMYQLNHSVHELDVYVKSDRRKIRDTLAGDRLLRNDGLKFTDVSEISGIYGGATGYGLSVVVSDLDQNGYPDIYVSNDFHENDYLYFNNGDGTFQEVTEGSMGHNSTFSMGNDAADINNDGLIDIFTLDMKPEDEVIRKSSAGADSYEIFNYKRSFGYYYQYPRNMLHLNRGQLFGKYTQFSEVGQLAGIDATDWSWSVLLADYDNDGMKDIYVTNGIIRRPNDMDYMTFTHNTEVTKNKSTLELAYLMPDGKASNYAYRNLGELEFEDVSENWGLDLNGCSNGAAYADFDNDGDMDLVVSNLNAKCVIYKNNSETLNHNRYLKITLEGNSKNRNGIGTLVAVYAGGQTMVQELNPVRGWLSSSDFNLNFGLGKSDVVDSVKVKWYDGKEQVLKDVEANSWLKPRYEDAVSRKSTVQLRSKLFEEIKLDSTNVIVHVENEFEDYHYEPLIPHKLSTEGPKIEVADVNGDGMEDFFLGGAKGQSSALFIQRVSNGAHSFERSNVELFEADRGMEDTDAVLFDADGDGDRDLYVVSGGSQSKGGRMNQDRLYVNKGNGEFEKSSGLPAIEANGACVVAADFNHDGSADLFVGSRSVVSRYGVSPDSYLLWNNGHGEFRIDTSDYAKVLHGLGMVTDAAWNEQEGELIVVGEWMPLTLLKFGENSIDKTEIPDSSGWWNTLYETDIDADGDLDYLIGNTGKNSELKASEEQPVKLIVRDWDQNGTIDPLITYYRQDKEWLFNGLDEVRTQMPQIRNRYSNYYLYAEHTLDKVFSDRDLESALIKKAENFSSTLLLNDKGRLKNIELPREMQISAIYAFLTEDFDGDGITDILSAGNFYGNSPSIGRFDASYGSCLLGAGKNKFSYLEPRESGFAVIGEVRDIESIEVGNETWILVGINNGELKIFKKK